MTKEKKPAHSTTVKMVAPNTRKKRPVYAATTRMVAPTAKEKVSFTGTTRLVAPKAITLDIEALVVALTEAEREYERLAFDEDEPRQLGAPASPDDLASLERHLGKPLPPSYRRFLELHNGWVEFDGDGNLLSTAEQKADWVKERIRDFGALFREFKGEDPFSVGAIPVLLGQTIHNYAVLDPRTARADGEMEVVTYDYTKEENRFKNFAEYLRYCLKITRSLIEREKTGADSESEVSHE